MASTQTINQQLAYFEEPHSLPLIDLRSEEEFVCGHHILAANFPLISLLKRMHELPKRTQKIALCGSSDQLKLALEQLTGKGYQVETLLTWNGQLKLTLEQRKQLAHGKSNHRLWSPAKIVERFQDYYLSNREQLSGLANCNASGKVLDIACGAGRDSVYMATCGWKVYSIDYLPDALDKLTLMAAHNNVVVNTECLDLEKALSQMKVHIADCEVVIIVRYLQRELLPLIKQELMAGGFIVYQTFLKGCEAFGSPRNPRYLLQPGELAEVFNGFDILVDEIEYLADGRPTNVFIARKPVLTPIK